MNMKHFSRIAPEKLTDCIIEDCPCGKKHSAAPLKFLRIGPDCLETVSDGLKELKAEKVFVVCGGVVYDIFGFRVLEELERQKIPYTLLKMRAQPRLLPNEEGVDAIEAAFDDTCDFVLGIGSGVINDLCKMTAVKHKLPCGIVATAPSMDGYASNSSAMELKGVKTTVYTTCPSLIVCDTELMRNAPLELIQSGLGDMLAKVISISDWRIAALITGEYYCDETAELMLNAFGNILKNSEGALNREEPAIRAVTEGLILSGIASAFTEMSRPASGMEHTVSHLLEMFALGRGMQPALHGVQVGVGTRLAFRSYRYLLSHWPAETDSLQKARQFDEIQWEAGMREAFGDAAEIMIENALKEERYSCEKVTGRIRRATAHRTEIESILTDTLQWEDRVNTALNLAGIPQPETVDQIGYTQPELKNALGHTADLRARYITTSLIRDLGLMTPEFISSVIHN